MGWSLPRYAKAVASHSGGVRAWQYTLSNRHWIAPPEDAVRLNACPLIVSIDFPKIKILLELLYKPEQP